MLDRLKLYLNITDNERDELLIMLIDMVRDEIKQFCRLTDDDIDDSFASLIIQMAAYRYNLTGCEGLSAESGSGTSYTYMTDYPESIMRLMRAKRRLRFL